MKKLSEQTKNNVRNASIFVLGVIVTIIITKTFDKILPNNPVIVKEFTDTIKIVHNYNIPKELDNDSTERELEKKLKTLELLNKYDRQAKERLKSMHNNDGIIPNLVLTNEKGRSKSKGYTYGSSSAYFTTDCPDFNTEYFDVKINFINPSITKDIAYLRLNIYKFANTNSTESKTYILEELFEVKSKNNIIRLSNDFSKGKYEILYGFVFKNELTKTYPSFNFRRCVVTK